MSHARTPSTVRTRRAVLRAGLAAAAAGLLLAACGSGGDGGGSAAAKLDPAKPVTVKVGVLPGAQTAPLYLGEQQGLFKAEGLHVELSLAQGGAALIPSLLNGEVQFSSVSTVNALTALGKKLPIKIISPSSAGGTTDANDWVGLMVKKGSTITTAKQLEGRTVAVNELRSLGEATLRASLQKKGVDVDKIKFVELPFPDMTAALDQGRVDAIWVIEPFYTVNLGAGATAIDNSYAGTMPGMTVATYVTSSKYAAEHPAEVQAFGRAVRKALTYAQDHPDQVRQVLVTQQKTKPELAAKVHLPQFPTEINQASVDLFATYLVDTKVLSSKPDFAGAVITIG